MLENKKVVLNMAMIFLSLFAVLVIRTQTVVLSYEVAQNFKDFKKQESSVNILTAQYQKSSGVEALVLQSGEMTALKAPKSKQVVMINNKGLAVTR